MENLSEEVGLRSAYAAHAAELHRFALRQLRDPGLAQDAVQETFLRAWLAAHRYDPTVASLRVWLFAIARNVMLDLHRHHRRGSWAGVSVADRVEDSLTSSAEECEAVLVRAVVDEAVLRLSEEHREVIVETYLRGRSYEELAAATGVSAGTLRSRMFYAMRTLRAILREMEVR